MDGSLMPALERYNCLRYKLYAFVLANHTFVQFFCQMKSLVSLTLVQFCYRNSGPPGNNPGDFLVCHCLMNKRQVFFLYLLLFLFQLFLKLRQTAVLKFCRFIQIIFPLCLLNIPVDLLDLFPDLLDTFHGSLSHSPTELSYSRTHPSILQAPAADVPDVPG